MKFRSRFATSARVELEEVLARVPTEQEVAEFQSLLNDIALSSTVNSSCSAPYKGPFAYLKIQKSTAGVPVYFDKRVMRRGTKTLICNDLGIGSRIGDARTDSPETLLKRRNAIIRQWLDRERREKPAEPMLPLEPESATRKQKPGATIEDQVLGFLATANEFGLSEEKRRKFLRAILEE